MLIHQAEEAEKINVVRVLILTHPPASSAVFVPNGVFSVASLIPRAPAFEFIEFIASICSCTHGRMKSRSARHAHMCNSIKGADIAGLR